MIIASNHTGRGRTPLPDQEINHRIFRKYEGSANLQNLKSRSFTADNSRRPSKYGVFTVSWVRRVGDGLAFIPDSQGCENSGRQIWRYSFTERDTRRKRLSRIDQDSCLAQSCQRLKRGLQLNPNG